jgi:uncharacterized protein (DUF427 family)
MSGMTEKTIKIPGPNHPITIDPTHGRVVVTAGEVVADSRDSLTLREASYPAVQYIPREDANMSLLQPTSHQTYCPYKGKCSYFSIAAAGKKGVNAVWSYEAPFAAVSEIKGHLALYPERVDSITVLSA